MHIKDHSAAMKFFRTYDSAASKGKWKEFVDEMEFDSMLQKPRTMAQEPRMGLQGGQLVQNTADGSRPGYNGKGGSSPEYRANLLENLPDGYLDDYKANFYNTIKDGKLTHVGGKQPPSVKGSLKKGIPYMMEKYEMKHGKIADTNSALKASFQSQIESGAKMGYNIRIGQLRAVAPWNPTAPKGMETHHFLPKLGIEGTDINFASTRNTAFISKELNRKMSPIDKKLKKIQLEQIELLENKPKDWRTKIKTLNERARGIYKNAAKEIPGSAGYLGFSEIKVKPDGSYTVEVRGIDYNKSLSGINKADEIFYRDPKTFKAISREDRLKVNKMSNIKSFSEKIRPKGTSGFIARELVEGTAKSLRKGAGKIGSGFRKVGGPWEVGFIGLDFINNLDSMDADTAFQVALSNATLGMYKGGKRAQWEDFETAGKELGHNPENLNEIKSIMDLEKMLTGEKQVLSEMIAYNAQEGTGEGLKGEFSQEEIEWRKDVVARLEKEFENKQNTFWSQDNAQDLVGNYQDTVGYVARKDYNKNLNREGAGKMFFGDKERRVNPDMNVIGSPLWQVITDWKDYVPQSILPQNFLQNYLTKAIPNTLRKLPGVLGDVWEPTSERAKLYDMSDKEIKQRAKDLNIQEQYYHPVTGNTMTEGQMEPYYEKFYSGGGIASLMKK